MGTRANIHDFKAAILLMKILKYLCSYLKTITIDRGYRGVLAENIRNTFGYVLQVVISGYKKQGVRPVKRHWVIVRSFAWFDYDRRLCRTYETTFDTGEQMDKISVIR